MAIETEADRAAVLTDWASEATYGATTVSGIFDQAFVEEFGMAGKRPVFLATTADLAAAGVAVDGTLTIDADNYTVRVLEHDGTGMTMAILEAQ